MTGLKLIIRNITKHKIISFISIGGLALGMAVSIILLLYVNTELSYDDYHRDADNIYRLEAKYKNLDGKITGGFASLAPAFTAMFEKDIPEFRNIVRIGKNNNVEIKLDDRRVTEPEVFTAEQDLFEIFSFSFIQGDPNTALKDPNKGVLSESAAYKYFGTVDIINNDIEIDGSKMQVTGVYRDVPSNTHFRPDMIYSYETLRHKSERHERYFFGLENVTDNAVYTYARLSPGADIESVKQKMVYSIDKHLGKRKIEGAGYVSSSELILTLARPVKDIHLTADGPNELSVNGSIWSVRLFTIIAVLVLLIACINFINLSTARAAERAKEIGLKKTLGATRREITIGLFKESFVITLLSFITALLIIWITLPYFSSLFNISFEPAVLYSFSSLLMTAGVLLFTALVSGIYPALYLSAMQPASILKMEAVKGKRGAGFRKALIVFQFSVTTALIILLAVVYLQLDYIMTRDPGFEKNNIVITPADESILENWESLKNELLVSPAVLSAATSKHVPMDRLLDAPGYTAYVHGEKVSDVHIPHVRIGYDFFKTYKVDLAAGRTFDKEISSDGTRAFILNETAVKKLGWSRPEEAIGGRFEISGRDGNIIGVVKDFNLEPLYSEILPAVFYIGGGHNTVSLLIAGSDRETALKHISMVLKKFRPGYEPALTFMDEKINNLYRKDIQFNSLTGFFSVTAVLIACLGLFGLTLFTAEKRKREIGIRKTLGASVPQVIALLMSDFMILISAAIMIGSAAAYFISDLWLQNYAYKIAVSPLLYIGAALLILILSAATILSRAWKASTQNPVKSLKYE